MQENNRIFINPDIFRAEFPYFTETSDTAIMSAASSIGIYISNILGEIELNPDLQIKGNYLACAHVLYIRSNPDLMRTIALTSASEGDVNASFRDFKNVREKILALTPYGAELLAILELVQPPLPGRRKSAYPYYRGTYGGWY